MSEDSFYSHHDSLQFYHTLRKCNDSYISKHVNHALDVLTDSLRLYGPDKVFSSYNGGKDADVIMHLLRAVYAKYSHDKASVHEAKLVYFVNEDEFDEVLTHIGKAETAYGLNITRYHNGIVQGLKQHLEIHAAGSAGAFVLGTRKGDPNCGDQETFAPSSNWMPVPFMRVNPILHWEYGHVWHFLRTFNLPYCSLYDQGYTSLGKKSQTLPNPALRRKFLSNDQLSNGDAVPSYWPAFMLSDWSLERAGRSKREVLVADSDCAVEVPTSSVPPLSTVEGQTAAMVIIGDEILNGFTTEVNLQVASKALASIGIPLRMVSIVTDEVDVIAAEVSRLSQRYDIVFTSGGIGPTHDDVTLKAIAQALDQEIVINEEMLQHLEDINYVVGNNLNDVEQTTRRLAMLPEQSKLRFPPPPDDYTSTTSKGADNVERVEKSKAWPILQCDNIFVLPGIPRFFAEKIHLIAKHFLTKQQVKESRKIVLDIEEQKLVETLDAIVAQFDHVKVGSYPFVDHPEFKTIVTVEGYSLQDVESAIESLLRSIPSRAVLRVESC